MRLIPINPPSTITEPQIPDAIARDTEVSAAIAAHIAASNPHSQYLSQNGKAADSELIDGIDSSRIVFGDDWSKTLGIDINSTISSNSGFLDCYSGGTFPSGIAHINGFQCRHRNNASIWGMQAGCQHNISTEFYFRTISSGVWQPWRRVWNDGNFDPNNHAQIFTQAAKALFLSNSGQISLQPPGGGRSRNPKRFWWSRLFFVSPTWKPCSFFWAGRRQLLEIRGMVSLRGIQTLA